MLAKITHGLTYAFARNEQFYPLLEYLLPEHNTREIKDTHLWPSKEMPPPGTIMWTCGWWVSADPQVCSTEVTPIRAPRCLGSAAIVIIVSAEALNIRS